MLDIHAVQLDYKDKPGVLAGVDLQADGGQLIGLVAPNGTGKTSLMNVILNRLHPSAGQVTINGKTYHNPQLTRQIHRDICAFPQQEDLYPDLSGRDHLQFYANCWANPGRSVAEVITALELGDYVDRPTGSYSLGMKQRLCFAMVVASNAPIMLLDEVMNGLDPINVALLSDVIHQLRAEGKLIIMVSHLLNNLETLADRVIFLKAGRFVQDIDMHVQRPEYLKFTADALPTAPGREQDENGRIVVPLAGVAAAQVAQYCRELFAAGVPYTVGPLSLEEEFNHFYQAAD